MRQVSLLLFYSSLHFIFSKASNVIKKPSLVVSMLLGGVFLAVCFYVVVNPDLIQADSPVDTIDSFDIAQTQLSSTIPEDVGTATSAVVTGDGILGGERDLKIELTTGIIEGTRLKANVGASAFYLAYDPTVAGSARIEWDGSDGDANTLDPTGLGGVDLTNGKTQDALLLRVSVDDLPVNPTFEVFTDADNSSTLALPLPGSINSPVDYVIPFSAFVPNLGNGTDFTNVGAITLFITSDMSLDVIFDSFDTATLLTAMKTDFLLKDNNGDNQVNPGDTLQYTVTISNPDDAFDADATGVVLSDTLDLNTTLVVSSVTTTQGTVTSGNNEGDTSVTVDIGTITDGDSVTITFEATISELLSEDVTEVVNQGFVSCDTVTNLPTNDPDTDTVADPTITPIVFLSPPAPPVISVTKTDLLHDNNDDGQVKPGNVLTYTVVIANSGNEAATGVVLSDTLDLNTTLVVSSVTTTQGIVTSGNNEGDTSVTVDIGTITDGDNVEVTFAVLVNDPLPEDVVELANQGTVSGSNFTDVLSDDPDTDSANDPTITPVVLP